MITKLNNLSLRMFAAAFAFFAASRTHAQEDGGIFGQVPDIDGISGDPGEIRIRIIEVVRFILSFMALIAVIMIVIAGIRLVISQGEEQEKDKAKKTIIYAIIGLIVILLAQAIVTLVQRAVVSGI